MITRMLMNQEPVAFYLPQDGEDDSLFRDARTVIACTGNKWLGWEPLYAHPPRREWQGLTLEEIFGSDEIMECNAHIGAHMNELMRLARAIEAALKERNA